MADGSTFPTDFPGSAYVVESAKRAALTGSILTAYRDSFRAVPDAGEVAAAVFSLIKRRGDLRLAMGDCTDGYTKFAGWYVLAGYQRALVELEEPKLLAERLEDEMDRADERSEKHDAIATGQQGMAERARAQGAIHDADALDRSVAAGRQLAAEQDAIARLAERRLWDVRRALRVAA